MAVPAVSPLCQLPSEPLTCSELLDTLEHAIHGSRSEWLFFRELLIGTGRLNGSAQRLDGFALNSLPHTGMKRVCYEIKTSRAAEILHRHRSRALARYPRTYLAISGGDVADPAARFRKETSCAARSDTQ